MKKIYKQPRIVTCVISATENLLTGSPDDCDSQPIVPGNEPGSGEQLSRESYEIDWEN